MCAYISDATPLISNAPSDRAKIYFNDNAFYIHISFSPPPPPPLLSIVRVCSGCNIHHSNAIEYVILFDSARSRAVYVQCADGIDCGQRDIPIHINI